MKPELKRLWDGAVKAAEQRAWEYGTLGDGAGNVVVPGLADRLYVNLGKTITMARNEAALPPTAGLAVRLRNENGTYVIYGKSNAGELAAPTPAATIQATNVAAALSGATAKVTPVDADGVPLIDSEASNGLKLLSWANLKATLKAYFDTLYVGLTGNQTVAGVKTFTSAMRIGELTTASNSIRTLNVVGAQAVARILRVSADIVAAAPAIELIHRTSADGADNSFWDIFIGLGSLSFRRRDGGNVTHLTLDGTGAGFGTDSPQGKAHIDQSSTTAAIPVLVLDQADVSEEFIEFIASVGAGQPIDTAALGTYYGKVRVSVNGTFKYLALYNS